MHLEPFPDTKYRPFAVVPFSALFLALKQIFLDLFLYIGHNSFNVTAQKNPKVSGIFFGGAHVSITKNNLI